MTSRWRKAAQLIAGQGGTWDGISAESVARMRLQNRFRTGLDIARYTAKVMRDDMAAYDADPANYTQSLGCWHGFIAQQKTDLDQEAFRHDQGSLSLSVRLDGRRSALRLRPAARPVDAREDQRSGPDRGDLHLPASRPMRASSGMMFRDLDAARAAGDEAGSQSSCRRRSTAIETHVVPIIADIDAGFGNAEATYLLAKKMIEAGACALQIENQVSDEKQCGHQDGKVTVPHEDFLAKIRACRYAFLELGIDDGIIVTRTDSLGAGLTKQIAVSKEPGDIGDQYNSFLDCEEIDPGNRPQRRRRAQPRRQAAAAQAAAVATCSSSAPAPARTAASSTASPRCRTAPTCCGSRPRSRTSNRSPSMVDRIREVVPNAKLVYNNSPLVQLDTELPPAGVRRLERRAGRDVCAYDRDQA